MNRAERLPRPDIAPTERVPMSNPDITAAERNAVNEVLQGSSLSRGGRLTRFEEEFAAFAGGRFGVGVSSGTAGLHLCVIAAGVGAADLVITTPFSFVASANAVLYERGVPIFVDIKPDSLNLDVDQVAEAADACARGNQRPWLPRDLRDGSAAVGRLKAILPVHAFGQPADMDEISTVAAEHDLVVIEDACEAVGAEYKNRRLGGAASDASVFAFYPNKQITTGEGGMIVTNREDWRTLLRSLRNQGRDDLDGWLNHSRLGFNYRLDEMSAALGQAQLGRVDELLTRRARVAAWYDERLRRVEGVHIPLVAPTTTRMSWFVYVIRLSADIDRDAVLAALQERGIPSRVYFTPIHLQPFYRQRFGYREGDFPVTEEVARSTLALPFFSAMSEAQVDLVCEQLASVVRRQAAAQAPVSR